MKPLSQYEYRKMMDQVHRSTARKMWDALVRDTDRVTATGVVALLIMSGVMLAGLFAWSLLVHALASLN